MRIALCAKEKPCFIDGECVKPGVGRTDYERWRKADSLVTSWLLNSTSKYIVDAFLYATFARDLWKKLEESYGGPNGPLLYQIQREISSISQGGNFVFVYYTKLKKLWDELSCLMPMPDSEFTTFNHLTQFLMGLNDAFDNIRNQILVMKPLPSVNKAYSLVLRVEKQREVNAFYGDHEENNVMMVRGRGVGKEIGRQQGYKAGNGKKEGYKQSDRQDKYYDHCKFSGHTRDNYFKLIGYPEWYTELQEQNRKDTGKYYANVANEKLRLDAEKGPKDDWKGTVNNMVQKEVQRIFKGKGIENQDLLNYAHAIDFAGNDTNLVLSSIEPLECGTWIVDTGHLITCLQRTHCFLS